MPLIERWLGNLLARQFEGRCVCVCVCVGINGRFAGGLGGGGGD